MSKKHDSINPKLVHLITGKDVEDIPPKPTLSMLPSQFGNLIRKNMNHMPKIYKTNKHTLTCKHCGKKGEYDLGKIFYDNEHKKKTITISDQTIDKENGEFKIDYIQSTGYFRCNHCNRAGAWELDAVLLNFKIMGNLLLSAFDKKEDLEKNKYAYGYAALFDGSIHTWASDGEEHLLSILEQEESSFVWNRLGNLYRSGGRHDLAVVAYERSLEIDPSQVESHYSLGSLLFDIKEYEAAAYHLRQMLVYASNYKQIEALPLRNLMVVALQDLLYIHEYSNNQIPFLPSKEEIAAKKIDHEKSNKFRTLDLDLDIDNPDTFNPLAEIYMGKRAEELPADERTLHKQPEPVYAQLDKSGKIALGSKQRPIIIKIRSEEKAEKIAQICERYDFSYIMGFEVVEDLSDLKKVLKEKLEPANLYDPCPCGSGQKYKFCCAKKMKNFDIERFIAEFN